MHGVEGEGGGVDGKGLKVGEGQKLNQKQLEMLVTAAEEQENSTNPLCKHDEFRFLETKMSVTYVMSWSSEKVETDKVHPELSELKNWELIQEPGARSGESATAHGDQNLRKTWREMQTEATGAKRKGATSFPINCLFEAASYWFFVCYKIYDEKTIEVGVFIDRHLYKNMEEVLN